MFVQNTPCQRNVLFSTGQYSDLSGATLIRGSENREFDGSPTQETCPNVWAGTVGNEPAAPNFGCSYPSTNNGCCGGWSDLSKFEEELTSGGTWNAARGWWEGGDPTGNKTSCFTNMGGNPNRQASNNIDNHRPQKVYTAGQVIDLSWIVTANHGGMVELMKNIIIHDSEIIN